MSLHELARAVDSNKSTSNETLPDLLRYNIPPTSKRLVKQRQTNLVYSTGGNSVTVAANTDNTTTQFNISSISGQVIDPRTFVLSGSFSYSIPGGSGGDAITSCGLGITSTIRRIQLRASNGVMIHDIDFVNVLVNILYRSSCNDDFFETVGREWGMLPRTGLKPFVIANNAAGNLSYLDVTQWAVDDAVANTNAGIGNAIRENLRGIFYKAFGRYANANDVYVNTEEQALWQRQAIPFAFPLWSILPFFRQPKYIPSEMNNMSLVITWENSNIAFRNTGRDQSFAYTFTNLQLRYDTCMLHDVLNMALQEKMRTKGIKFYVQDYYSQAEGNSVSPQITINIPKSCADAISVLACFRNTQDITNATAIQANSFFMKAGVDHPQLTNAVDVDNSPINPSQSASMYVQYGPLRIPDQPLNTVPLWLAQLNKTFGRYGDISASVINNFWWKYGYAVYSMDLQSDPSSKSGMSFTGLTLRNGTQLQLIFTGLNAENKTLNYFLEYSKVIIIKSTGITIEE